MLEKRFGERRRKWSVFKESKIGIKITTSWKKSFWKKLGKREKREERVG